VSKENDGAVTFVAAGLLVLGFALVTTRLIPARNQAAKTLGDEAELKARLDAAEAEGAKLARLADGLEKNDRRVLERFLRDRGAGKTGEVRVAVDGNSRPTAK
jgi:hypothetical protein